MTSDLPREFNADAAVNDLIALVGAVDGLTSMTTPAQIARIQEAVAPIIAAHPIYRSRNDHPPVGAARLLGRDAGPADGDGRFVPLVQHQGAAASASPIIHRHENPSSRSQWTNKNKFEARES